MSRFCPLFSSSSGNCTYIGYGDGAILIDAGVSCRSIMNALATREIAPKTIKAVAVTHSHSDHTAGLKALIKKLQIPVIASADTLRYLDEHSLLPPDCEKIVAEETLRRQNESRAVKLIRAVIDRFFKDSPEGDTTQEEAIKAPQKKKLLDKVVERFASKK